MVSTLTPTWSLWSELEPQPLAPHLLPLLQPLFPTTTTFGTPLHYPVHYSHLLPSHHSNSCDWSLSLAPGMEHRAHDTSGPHLAMQ